MERVWLKNYQEGVPHDIDPAWCQSVTEIFERSFQKFRDRPSFACMGKVISFRELDEMSARFAAYLQAQGFKKGDRLALMMPNVMQYPVALVGGFRAGMTIVNVNPLYTVRELEHQLKDSGAEAIVILANFASTLEKVLDKVPIRKIIVTGIGDLLGFPKSLLVNFVVKNVKKMVPPYKLPGAVPFKQVIAGSAAFKQVALGQEDIAFLQYTGGTTGISKGAVLLHRNITANVAQARAWIGPKLEEGREIIITPLPLYHIFSLTANFMTYFSIGGLCVLIPNPRDMPGFVKELKKWRFTSLTGVNTLFNGLLNNPDFASVDFSHFKLALGGGMAVQRAVAERWQQVTKSPLVEAYGLTETIPAVCINPMNLKEYNGYIGLPVCSTEVTIRDEEGKELPQGEPGELCVRGPQVMKEYWNRPDETAKVFFGEWLRTGDIAEMNEEGYFKIVDRKKDMILVSGFNVFPNEVEDVFAAHEGVLEVAAVGVPDEKSTEAVKIFVVRRDPNLTAEALLAWSKDKLTGYKRPKHVEFRDELPKTNVGKILRRALRE